MIYRKTPLQSPRMLLRIAVTAGVAVAATSACSSSNQPVGFSTIPERDSGAADPGGSGESGGVGLLGNDAGVVLGVTDSGGVHEGGIPGLVPPGGGDDGGGDTGPVGLVPVDGGTDGDLPDVVLGVVDSGTEQ